MDSDRDETVQGAGLRVDGTTVHYWAVHGASTTVHYTVQEANREASSGDGAVL